MSIKEDIRNQIKSQIKQKTNPQPDKSLGGFFSNLGQDIAGFGKGLLGLAQQPFRHPIETTKTIGSTGVALAKEIPGAIGGVAKEVGQTIIHPVERTKELVRGVRELNSIPYETQKELFKGINQDLSKSMDKMSRGEKLLTQLGSGLTESFIQEISHPIEFAYEKPLTFGLDVMSVGGGKVLSKSASLAGKPLKATKAGKNLTKLFKPQGSLRAAGFTDVANDVAKTNEKIFNIQGNIIRDTARKFEKDFSLTKAERFEFFDTIDSLRRAKKGVVATSKNPRIQKAIDWWLKEEVPNLQKIAGISDEASITNYLHHFFPEKAVKAESKLIPLKVREGFKMKSKDVAGFSKDPITSISAIKIKVGINALKESFISKTVKKYGKNIEDMKSSIKGEIGAARYNALEQSGKLDDFIKKHFNVDTFSPKKDVIHWVDKALADELSSMYGRTSAASEALELLTTPLRVFNNNWKPLATAVRPRYHTRNVVGNIYNSVVLGNMNIRQMPKAAKLQLGKYIDELATSSSSAGKIYKKLFPKKPSLQMIDNAIEDGVINKGFFAMDLHDMAEASLKSDDLSKVINSATKDPAAIYKIPVLKQWLKASQNIGTAIENNARLSLYMDRIGKGYTRSQARRYVDKYLFNYMTGLGEGDKIIKRIIPFWSWQRFNTPLQIESLATRAGRQSLIIKGSDPFVKAVENKDPNAEFLTDDEKKAGLLKVAEIKKNGQVLDKYIRTQSVLPQADLNRVVKMFELDFSELGVNPVFDLVSRLNKNEDFWGNKIEAFKGERKKFLGLSLRGKVSEALKIIPFLSEVNKAIGGSYTKEKLPSGVIRLEQILSPLGTTIKDREQTKFFGALREQAEISGSYEAGLKTMYKRYLEKSAKNPEEKAFKQNVETLEKLLNQKGVSQLQLTPLKIEATKEAVKAKIQEKIKAKIQEGSK